ncbi:hypothetical protein HY633_04945 [Candidatus Uhrbacteria bacterium]|nr:hypothetical protein [Candidatus Uhrbacteria bacterium]
MRSFRHVGRRRHAALMLFAAVLAFGGAASAAGRMLGDREIAFGSRVLQASVLLYSQTETGDWHNFCTATAFEREGGITRFITAAHCFARDDPKHERVIIEESNIRAVFSDADDQEVMRMYRMRVVGAGYKLRKDDCGFLEIEGLDRDVPIIPVARGRPKIFEPVINIAGANGLGLQALEGNVTIPKLKRPIGSKGSNWNGNILLDLPTAKRSSGSAIVSLRRPGIIGILAGTSTDDNMVHTVAVPIDRCLDVWKKIKADEYRWFSRPRAADADDAGLPDGDEDDKIDLLMPDP